jgi:hypothetical protein
MIKLDISNWENTLSDIEKNQLPFATARALSEVAKLGKDVQQGVTNKSIDRPNPYTKAAMYSTTADKRGPYSVDIGYKRQQAAYLAPLLGGERRQKPFERVINGISKFLVPGAELEKQGIDGIKLDQYGNIPKSQIEFLVAIANSGAKASDGKTDRYFRGVPKGGRFGDGVFARVQDNNKIQPLLLFVDKSDYTTRINFDETTKFVKDKWSEVFEQELSKALATAK